MERRHHEASHKILARSLETMTGASFPLETASSFLKKVSGGGGLIGYGDRLNVGAQQKFSRPHLIKENEWPDHLSLRGWQRPPHGKAAEVPRAGHDDYVNRVTSEFFTRLRIWPLPAHV